MLTPTFHNRIQADLLKSYEAQQRSRVQKLYLQPYYSPTLASFQLQLEREAALDDQRLRELRK
jgi:hypothetical protein